MANKGGTITLKEIIEEEALKFGEIYAKNVDIAIQANENLKKSAKGLSAIMADLRGSDSNYKLIENKAKEKTAIDKITDALRTEAHAIKELNEERARQIAGEKLAQQIAEARQKGSKNTKKSIDDETAAHKKLMNSIKEEEQLEKSVQKTKQETLRTDKAATELATKIIQQETETLRLMQQEEALKTKQIATEREETKLLKELEDLEQRRLTTQKSEIALLNEEERLKRSRLAVIREENSLTEQEQRIIKNTLDIKSKELNIAKQEEAARKRNTVLTEEEKVQNQELAKAKRLEARENLGLVGAYEKLNRQRTEAQRNLANLLAAEDRNTREIIRGQREYDVLNRRIREVDQATDIFTKNIGNYQSAFGGFGDMLTALTAAFGISQGIDIFTDVVRKAITILREYEAEVVNLAAIAGKTRDEIQPLEEEIQNVAAASINGATDVAKLATELIKLGSTPEEAAKLLKPVNDLSLALRASAEDAATLVKSLLNAYGEGAQEAARYTDVLAESANRSALDFQGLRDAFSYLAPTAKTLGFSLEKTAALLGILADNGIKAESAGRLTSTALLNLAKNGLTLEDALDKINKAQAENASELQLAALAGNLFGAEAAKIGIILASNREKIEANTVAYENSRGALAELTDKQLKSLDAQIKILDSSFEDYILKLNESTGFTDKLTEVTKFLANNLDVIIDTAFKVVAAFVVYKTAMLAGSVATRIQTASIYAQILAQALMTRGIAGLRAELTALSVATKLNPYALIATAVIGLIYYLTTLNKTLAEQTAEVKKSTGEFLKSRDAQEGNIKNLEKMVDRYDELSKKVNRTASEQKELNEITKVLGEVVPEATKKINKYGEALVISSDKIREYVKLQKEVLNLKTDVELEKNQKLLKELTQEQNRFNRATDASAKSETYIVALGEAYKNVNGVLSRRKGISNTMTALDKEELLLFKQKALKNEQEIAQTEARIRALKRLQNQADDTNKAVNNTGDAKPKPVARTIAVIDEEIKAEQDKIDNLTYATRAEGILIDKRIAALKKEREAIYSTQKAQKDLKKAREEYLAALKKIDDNEFALMNFRLNRIKSQNDEILADTNATDQELIDAAYSNEAVLSALAEEAAEKRLRDISRYNDKVRDLTDAEIKIALEGGDIIRRNKKTGKDELIKLNTEELLAVEQYQAEKVNITKATEKQIDDIQLKSFEKRLNEQLRLNNIAVNNDLIAENDRFNNEEVNNTNRAQKIEEHEKKIAAIKKKYAIQALQDQITALETLLATETLAADKRKEIETNVSNLKKELSDTTLKYQEETSKSYKELLLGEELSEEQKKERILDLSKQLHESLINLANAVFDARIQKIDDEIKASEDYYNKQIELAGNDQRQKELLEKEAEKKREALEKKKKEEQRKQAIFNKALKIVDITVATALGIMQSYAQLGPILGNVGAALVGALGAIQLAAVIATPIPKYKGGRKGGPAEFAIVGDGGVSEVIEDTRGRIRLTPNTDTLVKLNAGDTVHSSKEAYMRHRRGQILSEVDREFERANRLQNVTVVERDTDKLGEIIDKSIQRGFKKAQIHVHNEAPKIDLAHEIWKLGNVNWSKN